MKKLASGFHSKLTSSRPARFLKHTRGRGDAAEQLRTRRTERTMGRVVCVTASYYQYRTALGELKKKKKKKDQRSKTRSALHSSFLLRESNGLIAERGTGPAELGSAGTPRPIDTSALTAEGSARAPPTLRAITPVYHNCERCVALPRRQCLPHSSYGKRPRWCRGREAQSARTGARTDRRLSLTKQQQQQQHPALVFACCFHTPQTTAVLSN